MTERLGQHYRGGLGGDAHYAGSDQTPGRRIEDGDWGTLMGSISMASE